MINNAYNGYMIHPPFPNKLNKEILASATCNKNNIQFIFIFKVNLFIPYRLILARLVAYLKAPPILVYYGCVAYR
jgi:hypothetical protein